MNAETKPTKSETLRESQTIAPHVDVFENSDELLVIADMPGVAEQALAVHFEKGKLTLNGKRTAPPTGVLRHEEAPTATFERTFLVPQGIDAERISAELSAGVLTVHLPKQAAVKPRRIEIKAS